MAHNFDVVIRNGTVVDGSGRDGLRADVGITGGVIAAVGAIAGAGAEEIDASGMLVTPGFVDIHTHYDGQAIWSDRLAPSSEHGVTTTVLGNCGVGFAPCRRGDHERLVSLMEGVEDIPEAVMTKGLAWDWETFPEYLDALARRSRDIDVAVYLPHSPLRVYAMGERGLRHEQATDADLERMRVLAREALQAGAIGFATSRFHLHRSGKGEYIPSFEASERELHAIAHVFGDAKAGVIQIAPEMGVDPHPFESEIAMLERLASAVQRPVTFTFLNDRLGRWRDSAVLVANANAKTGGLIKAQFGPRAIGFFAGLETSVHPFSACPSYRQIEKLPFDERLAAMRQPELRARLISEESGPAANAFYSLIRRFDLMFELGDPPQYEQPFDHTIAARAARAGISPAELAYDGLLKQGGRALLYVAVGNYVDGNLDFATEMMKLDDFVFGLGDGGAHYGLMCDAGYTTFALAHWTRDRHGARVDLPTIVKGLTYDNAMLMGFRDRGLIAPGYKADVNVIDHGRLGLRSPEVVFDLPGRGRRVNQGATGYVATLVSGKIILRNDTPTGQRPGRLVRGPQQSAATLPR